MRLRCQLPVHSPVSAATLAGAAADVLQHRPSEATVRARFESDFPGAAVALTDSGTSALTLAIAGARRLTGSAPVALPAFGCYDVATAALGAGARGLLYDVDPTTLAPDLGSLRAALDSGAGSVVCASLYGLPAAAAESAELVRAAGAVLIMDGAQAWGAIENGRPFAAYGSLGVLSFGRGKGFTGGAGGGLLGLDEPGRRAVGGLTSRAATRLGWDDWARAAALWLFARPGWYGIPSSIPRLRLGETVYHEPRPLAGMSVASAALLCRGWTAASRELAARRGNAARLRAALTHHPTLRTPAIAAGARPSFLRLPVRVEESARHSAVGDDPRGLGILRSYPGTLADLPQLAAILTNARHEFPGARELARSLYTLPTHGLLRARDLRALEAWIRTMAGKRQPGELASGAEEELEAEVGG